MRIGLTYDLRSEYLAMGYGEKETAEFDRDDTITAIESSLNQLGYGTDRIGHIRTLTAKLAAGKRWDLVFNIAEGMSGYAREAQVPALLEAFSIPYTGSDPLTLAMTHHKGYTKRVVAGAGVPTPHFAVVVSEADIGEVNLPFPLFVKPVAEGTGKGITGKSHVTSPAGLAEQCRYILKEFRQPALVETYLPGREITVGVLGSAKNARVAGVLEIESLEGAEEHAYTYYNKEFCENVVRYTLVNDPAVVKTATEICLASWQALGGRDFCRMDLRGDADGNFSFMEVNALPGLHPQHSDLPMIGERVGLPYTQLIRSIVDSARQRYGI